MTLLNEFVTHFHKYLTPTQFQTLSILLGLLNQYKQVKIEKLAEFFPLPILFESRRKHIQRFLTLVSLSIPIIWFPIIQIIIAQQFPLDYSLIIVLDRTQWRDKNIFMISVIWHNHALPIYWNILNKKGASNFKEQKALIKPVLKLLKNYQVIIIGDREFHSVELANWLKKEKKKRNKKIDFAFRQKKDTFFHKGGKKYQKLSEIEIEKGVKQIMMGIKLTKKKGFGQHNLGIYHKKNQKNKSYKEPWDIITSLNSVEEVMKIYATRSGIEAMFKDCKTGGYNLEGTKANTLRLTNIILLIAIAYTNSALKGEILKRKAKQKYIGRPEEKRRKTRRHSEFWLGLYGEVWCNNYESYLEEINLIMQLNLNKLSDYQRGLKAMEEIKKVYE
jgi:hypothetical protein